jgi:hypothetical protein
MQTSVLRRTVGLLLLLVLAGCETNSITRRIEEKSTAYARLAPGQQANIRQGVIELGFTADMVYMALGHPGKTTIRHTAEGPVGIWIYDRPRPVDPQFPARLSPLVGLHTPATEEPPDRPAEILYVLFFKGRVVEIKLAAPEE